MSTFTPVSRALAGLVLALGLAQGALAQTASLSVTGTAEVAAAPDMATIQLGVQAEAPQAAEALSQMSEDMTQVLTRLAAAGIADRDVQTGSLQLYPRYADRTDRTGPPPIAGYVAMTDVSVRVRDLDALGALLDQLVQDGANRLSGISFGLSDPETALNEARAAAVADAMARADLYATAAGLALGPVLSMSEPGSTSLPRPLALEAMDAARSVPIAAGEVTTTARIDMTFALIDPNAPE